MAIKLNGIELTAEGLNALNILSFYMEHERVSCQKDNHLNNFKLCNKCTLLTLLNSQNNDVEDDTNENILDNSLENILKDDSFEIYLGIIGTITLN